MTSAMRRGLAAWVACAWVAASLGAGGSLAGTVAEEFGQETLRSVRPGEPGVRPFWNRSALRYIYAPAFDFPEVTGAAKYRFTVRGGDGVARTFVAEKPWAALSPVWGEVPEGATEVAVEAIGVGGEVAGKAGTATFYRSPAFGGTAGEPVKPYGEAGRWALAAIYRAPHVQHWRVDGKPDPDYNLYCYPSKVMGALVRAMVAYSKATGSDEERKSAVEIGRRVADHLISVSLPATARYAYFPPTYSLDVNEPMRAAVNRAGKWMFLPTSVDTALGYLDLYDVTKDRKYFDAAKAIAETYRKTQGEDGTWPIVVDHNTGEPLRPNRQIPTWVILFMDRLDQQYGLTEYRGVRERAWNWIVANPLKTYRWEGQFEDGTPRDPYINLAREQACDVACMLLEGAKGHPENVGQAEELLRFAEDQFVVWSPIKDPEGWAKVMPQRRKNVGDWITPGVMEQYGAYAPVARSSAILINTYLVAYRVTGRAMYREKAHALANGLVAAQAWLAEKYNGNGEIPTWLTGHEPINWLNNSYYAAEALLNVGRGDGAGAERAE